MSGPVKAYLQSEQGERIDCLFNPAELQLSKSNSWTASKAKGRNTPPLRFQEGQSGSMSMSLLLDTTDTGEAVTAHTNRLLGLMRVDPNLAGSDTKRNRARPPWVRFHWGGFRSFKAVVDQLQLTFTYFSATGVPLRAKADLTLTQYEDEEAWGPQNPTSGTPSPHRVHQVSRGETIDRIAARHFSDATRWRLIADANGLTDPLRLQPGTALVIPETEAVHRRG
jgi:hypothetical protein